MTSIGESLRRERLQRNLQLEQISNELKISARMLAAIEAGDFQKLPGGVFAKSFVRQYAHFLGLDEEEMAAEVGRMLDPAPAPAETTRPQSTPILLPRMEAWQSVSDSRSGGSRWSASLPALMLVVLVMALCSGIYAFLERPRRTGVANTATEAETHPSAVARETAPPAPDAPVAPAAAAAPESQPPQLEETPAAAAASSPAAAGPPAAAASAAQKPAESSSAVASPGQVHVELTANEPVWIRASSDGKYVFSGILAVHQSRTVDANQNVELRLGNAGGVTILLNGKPIGAVGPEGQVRNIQLTSGGFQIVAAPPRSAPVFDPL